MSSEEFDEEMFDLRKYWIGRSFYGAHGLKELIQCISDWRVFISLYKTQFRVDAGAVLDRISAFASSSCFIFKQINCCPISTIRFYGVITIDIYSIPEVARHTQRIIAAAAAAM